MLIPSTQHKILTVRRNAEDSVTQSIPGLYNGNGYLDLFLSYSSFSSMSSSCAVFLNGLEFSTTVVHSSFYSCSDGTYSSAILASILCDNSIFLSANCFNECRAVSDGLVCRLTHASEDSKGFLSTRQVSLCNCGKLGPGEVFNTFFAQQGYVDIEFANFSECEATRVSSLNFKSISQITAKYVNVQNSIQETCTIYITSANGTIIRSIFVSNDQTNQAHVDKGLVVATNGATVEVRECSFSNNVGYLLAVPHASSKILCVNSYFDTQTIGSGTVVVESKLATAIHIPYEIVGNSVCIGKGQTLVVTEYKTFITISLSLINFFN